MNIIISSFKISKASQYEGILFYNLDKDAHAYIKKRQTET